MIAAYSASVVLPDPNLIPSHIPNVKREYRSMWLYCIKSYWLASYLICPLNNKQCYFIK